MSDPNKDKRGKYIIGNRANQLMSVEEWTEKFIEMYEWLIEPDNEALSITDIYTHFKIGKTTFMKVARDNEDCKEIRELMHSYIISVMNKKALIGEYQAAPAIWRMKQCGEEDKSTVNQKMSGGVATAHRVIFEDYSEEKE